MKAIIFLFIAISAQASNYKFQTAVPLPTVAAQLQAAGISYDNLYCDGTICAVENASADTTSVFPNTENTTRAFVIAAQNSNRIAAVALLKLLRAGTATQAQKDELLGRLAFILLGQ